MRSRSRKLTNFSLARKIHTLYVTGIPMTCLKIELIRRATTPVEIAAHTGDVHESMNGCSELPSALKIENNHDHQFSHPKKRHLS